MKKKDSLLGRATWKIRNMLPDPVECYCIRIYRRVLQFKGYPFSRRRPGVVIMLHIGRCGSTVLANMLDQNPNIFWDGKTARRAHEIYGDSVKTLDISTWFKCVILGKSQRKSFSAIGQSLSPSSSGGLPFCLFSIFSSPR